MGKFRFGGLAGAAALATALLAAGASAAAGSAPFVPCDAQVAKTTQARDVTATGGMAQARVENDKILAIPDISSPNDNRRCDISLMSVSVRNNGQLRDIYVPGEGRRPPDTHWIFKPLSDNPIEEMALQKAAFIDPVIEHLRLRIAQKVRERLDATPGRDPKVLVQQLEDNPIKVLIYAHGGLVSQDKAVYSAESLAPVMIRDDYIPLFLIWNNEFQLSYLDRLCCVRRGSSDPESHINQWVFVPTRLIADLGGGIASLPENLFQGFLRFKESELTDDYDLYYLNYFDVTQDCFYFTRPRKADSSCPNVVFPNFGYVDDGTEQTAKKYKSLLNGGAHVLRTGANLVYIGEAPFRAPLTGLASRAGGEAWDNMLRRTRLAFDNESTPNDGKDRMRSCHDGLNPQGNRTVESPVERQDEQLICLNGGFTRFFDGLKAFLAEGSPDGRMWISEDGQKAYIPVEIAPGEKITVPVSFEYYGHSMGAIIGDELISRYPGFPWSKVVYMAAADTVRDFKNMAQVALSSFPDTDRKIAFYNLTLHPLAETREREGAGFVPEGSLLEWIDEFFNGPKTGDDRTFGKWKNDEATFATWPTALLQKTTFRVFPSQTNLNDGKRTWEEIGYFKRECDPSAPIGPDGKLGRAPTVCYPLKHGDFNSYSFWRRMYLTGSLPEAPPAKRR